MKPIRWAAAAATALMSLMNLPTAFDYNHDQINAGFAWLITLVGVAGLVAASGLARRLPWGRPAVLAIGVVNVAGAVVALANGWDGAPIGLTVSLIALVLAWFAQPVRVAEPVFD
jgi:hypothetical protein